MIKSGSEILYFVQAFADNAHGQQVRKYTGERYIVHPVRVMEMTREFHHDVCIHAAALLHDVIEDTAVTIDQLEKELLNVMGGSEVRRVIQMVVELTDSSLL